MAHVLVVGAGLAGARTCSALRAAGFQGRITLVGAEHDPPYDRPPLSKDPGAEVDLRQVMGLDVWDMADDVRLGTAALALALTSGGLRVELVDAAVGPGAPVEVEADAVVVATGATPVLPAGWSNPAVHVLHTRADADRFWHAVDPGVPVVIVGGGWIGCEVAATAARRGARVELFEAAGQLLPGRVPAEVASRIAGWVHQVGATLHLGSPVVDIGVEGGEVLVRAEGVQGRVQGRGAAALVCLGVQPETGWLAGSGVGRAGDGAVLVDMWGRSDLPGLFAVGDAAARWSPALGRHVPGGHWTEALNAPEILAPAVEAWVSDDPSVGGWRASPGGPQRPVVPYVFSEIAGRMLQVLGDAGTLQDDVVWVESDAGWSAYVVDGSGGLRGVCSVGRPRDITAARRAMLAHPTARPPVSALVGS